MKKLHCKKLSFYLIHLMKLLRPRFYLSMLSRFELARVNQFDSRELNDRVSYYCKLNKKYEFSMIAKSYKDISIFNGMSAQSLELKNYFRYFPKKMIFDYKLGDVTKVPDQPSFVKSRPIEGANSNSILLKLNAGRFYNFQKDRLSFNGKKPIAVFRGPCHKKHRQVFIDQTYRFPNTDIGDTRNSEKLQPYYKGFMSQSDQLKFKYIISVEGNDVATNLSWIMASNSLAFMKKPKYETWFMQGVLIPNYHYVLLKDDYSDLPEKIDYYNRHTQEALDIISNAHKHVAQFFDHKRERLISLLVLKKYFELSGQM